ncbi:hypothetical protein [Lysobacter sp. CA196]|uniref:hypothetical protein n=1 Tax=Lysobacter sp. CA196 TaxID=3455606 RepID=UPI003F8D5186
MTMPERAQERDAEIEAAVLGYIGAHPLAADTLDGIVRWWLPQQRYVTAHARIEATLERLVDDGALRLRRLPDGTALYSLGRAPTPFAS